MKKEEEKRRRGGIQEEKERDRGRLEDRRGIIERRERWTKNKLCIREIKMIRNGKKYRNKERKNIEIKKEI